MQHKKRGLAWSLLIWFILLSALLTGCGYTADEIKQMKQYEKTGRKNAVAYIEEKYGFQPKVMEVFCDKVEIGLFWDASPDATGYVHVKLREKETGTEFWVYTTGEAESTQECWDNYQYREIEQAVRQRIEALLHEQAEHIDLCYGKYGDDKRTINASDEVEREYGLLHDYFDGANLSEVLGNAEYNKMAVCMITDNTIPGLLGCEIGEADESGICQSILPKDNEWIRSFGNNVGCLLINYNDAIACDLVHENWCPAVLSAYDINQNTRDACFYIKEYYCVAANTDKKETCAEYSRYEIKQKDDFYYVTEGGSYCDFTEAEKEMRDASNWNGRGFLDAKKVYQVYRVDSDARCVHVFIPIKSLQVDNVSEYMGKHCSFRLVEQRYFDDKENGWELDYDTCITDVVGNTKSADTEKYLTTTIYLHDFYKDIIFSVFVDEGD